MTFDEVLGQVQDLLQREKRVSYRGLKRRFALDDEYLEDLKEELIGAKRIAADEDGRFLIWTGGEDISTEASASAAAPAPRAQPTPAPSDQPVPAGERRQLTVMFCDLVGSTALSEQLDPEDLHAVVRTYQDACRQVIERYDGHIAQYLGDGILVYFGYPAAHEDDVVRGVRAGLDILTAISRLELAQPIQARIGLHTGPVVIGTVGGGEHTEQLALGETPNIAARVQGKAVPNTVAISADTYRLVQGFFTREDLGPQELKGLSSPLTLYQVTGEGEAQNRFDVSVQRGLTPLVGREEECELLLRRWERAKAGDGQVVLLSGEAGIGKSRLVQVLRDHSDNELHLRILCRCSPFYQNSALYPVIAHVERVLEVAPDDTPAAKLEKLQSTLSTYRFPQTDTVPLLAALLSLPHPESSPSITVSPQKQKEQTQAALVAWLFEETEKAPVCCTWEDLHWADPSTLEFLSLCLDQIPTTRMLTLLTFRPEFTPPWGIHSYLSQLTLNRLGRPDVGAMVEKVTGGRTLPAEVMEQIASKTDGVPLFVEELTKMVVESDLVRAVDGHYELTGPLPLLAIPSTLQDSLMARLDRLAPAKEVAQLGATLGREFSYEVIQAVSPLDEATLQQALGQLVEAELVYQRGLPPQAQYVFKHVLIQDTAYQSLLKSRRQQLHQQVAHVLEKQFAETVGTQPELVAHHYTEAGLVEPAILYWQRAGERAVGQSANVEAVEHLTTGLNLMGTLPDSTERAQQELILQTTLGPALMATKGWGAVEVEKTYTRARVLCQQVGSTAQLFPVLHGLWFFYYLRARYQTARELGEQLLGMAENSQDSTLLLEARHALGPVMFHLGEVHQAQVHLEFGITLYDPQQHHTPAIRYTGHDAGVCCWNWKALSLWFLGYPDQAVKSSAEALTLAHELGHPLSRSLVLYFSAQLHQMRREASIVQERAEAMTTLGREQEFALTLAQGAIMEGWALAQHGLADEGIAQIHRGLAASQSTGGGLVRPYSRSLLAGAYGRAGQAEEGMTALDEALTVMGDSGERCYEAELYRLKGELALQQSQENRSESETCFQKALEVARKQEAKSWELRASTSLARLWQQQGRKTEGHQLLAPVYNWFTEGFDTKDLQEAKTLLEELD